MIIIITITIIIITIKRQEGQRFANVVFERTSRCFEKYLVSFSCRYLQGQNAADVYTLVLSTITPRWVEHTSSLNGTLLQLQHHLPFALPLVLIRISNSILSTNFNRNIIFFWCKIIFSYFGLMFIYSVFKRLRSLYL